MVIYNNTRKHIYTLHTPLSHQYISHEHTHTQAHICSRT